MTPLAESVSTRLRQLYGVDPASERGVLHVVAAWRAPGGALRVIRIGPDSPVSETDTFVLRATRMRCDAIVTTGKILRDEESLEHVERDASLLAWRSECVGRLERPRTVVLTSGRELDPAHPVLRTAHAPLIVTSVAAEESVRQVCLTAPQPIEVIGRPQPDLRDTIAVLRELGCQTIGVEAGPTTSAALYESPPYVDELLLSVFESDELDSELVGPAFASSDRLREVFASAGSEHRIDEPSGRWTFTRRLR